MTMTINKTPLCWAWEAAQRLWHAFWYLYHRQIWEMTLADLTGAVWGNHRERLECSKSHLIKAATHRRLSCLD